MPLNQPTSQLDCLSSNVKYFWNDLPNYMKTSIVWKLLRLYWIVSKKVGKEKN